MNTNFSISYFNCYVYSNGTPYVVFYWGTANGHTDIKKIIHILDKAGAKNYLLCAYEATDWNADFSPWAAPPVFGNEGFKGNGKATLAFLKEKLIPYIKNHYPETANATQVLAGYSLAGLFSLWASINGDFKNVISCSGSLWFPDWLDYLKSTPTVSDDAKFYISLGDKESKTKNKVMANVDKNTLATVEFLKRHTNCYFEWNKGGHFSDVEKRIAKGFLHFLNIDINSDI